MCEVKDIPPEIVRYIVDVANGELTECAAFFPTPKGEIRGRIVIRKGELRFIAEGSEEIKAYVARCRPITMMNISTYLELPDGTLVIISRHPRHPGDVEGDPRHDPYLVLQKKGNP